MTTSTYIFFLFNIFTICKYIYKLMVNGQPEEYTQRRYFVAPFYLQLF